MVRCAAATPAARDGGSTMPSPPVLCLGGWLLGQLSGPLQLGRRTLGAPAPSRRPLGRPALGKGPRRSLSYYQWRMAWWRPKGLKALALTFASTGGEVRWAPGTFPKNCAFAPTPGPSDLVGPEEFISYCYIIACNYTGGVYFPINLQLKSSKLGKCDEAKDAGPPSAA